jgi:hypothetical protein
MSSYSLIFNDKDRDEIRKNLKKAIDHSIIVDDLESKYNIEVCHKKFVPFEGSVCAGTKNALNTQEINEKYTKSIPSLWWIITQSVFAYIRKLFR